MNDNKYLISERPLIVLPSLAKALGTNEAIILQQIHFWLQLEKDSKEPKYYDGRYWIYNTYEDWHKQFSFMGFSTVKEKIKKLEKLGYLITGNYNKMKQDNTKWYTIDYDKFTELGNPPAEIQQTTCQNSADHLLDMSKPLPYELTYSTSYTSIINNTTISFTLDELNEKLTALDKKKPDYYKMSKDQFHLLLSSETKSTTNLLKSKEENLLHSDKISTSAPLGAILWVGCQEKAKRKVPVEIEGNLKSFVKVAIRLIKSFNRLPDVSELNQIITLLEADYSPLNIIRGLEASKQTTLTNETTPYIADVKEAENNTRLNIASEKAKQNKPAKNYQKPQSDFRAGFGDREAF